MAQDLHSYVAERITDAKKNYLADLKAMSQESVTASPGGKARTPLDFSYEVAFVNRRIAARIRGDDLPPMKFEGWITAPEGYGTLEKAVADVEASTDEVIEAWGKLDPDEMEREIVVGENKMTPLGLATLCAVHLNYHDAQLNYHQAISGDDAVHWE